MHSQALDDPAYLYKLDEAQEATGGKLGAFCNTCHGPIATMSGEIESGDLSAVSAEGVTCTFCHYVTGTTEPVANVSQLVSPGVRRAQIKDPQAPHAAAYSQFHESAEICGSCHNVNHPVNGMHLEATYTEWLNGPYSKQGIVCQTCHMSPSAGIDAAPYPGEACGGGPERDNIFAMSVVGANVAQGPPEASRAMLQAAAEVALDLPAVVAPGAGQDALVTVTNVGAGHYLPTGLTEVRQMWLEVTAQEGDGEPEVIAERRFVTILQDDAGNAPVELWEATSIKSDDRIPPQESVTETVAVEVPAEDSALTIKAELKYQSLPDEFAEAAGVENPVTVMASAEQAVYGSDDAQREAVAASEGSGGGDAMRLVIVIGGLALIFGIIVWFAFRSRRTT